MAFSSVHDEGGWDALIAIDYSLQKPRPRNPKAASESEQEAFKKRMARPVRKGVCRGWRLISLLQRIRPRRSSLPAKMEMRALRSS